MNDLPFHLIRQQANSAASQTSTGSRGTNSSEKTANLGFGWDIHCWEKDPESNWETAATVGFPHGVGLERRHIPSRFGIGAGLAGPYISLRLSPHPSEQKAKPAKEEKPVKKEEKKGTEKKASPNGSLPSQLILQQQQARKVSGEELETFGKYAAKLYSTQRCPTLGEAVVQTVKTAALSPEQVKRVVEFANTAAYLEEFHKEGQKHRYIELSGGPADPGAVLRDLNDGGNPTVVDRNERDYLSPPPTISDSVKMGSDARLRLGLPDLLDAGFQQAREELNVKTACIEYNNPLHESLQLRTKLAGLHDQLLSETNLLEGQLMNDETNLYQQVKEAVMAGNPMGDVLTVWHSTKRSPEFTKCAFQFLTPLLVQGGVFKHPIDVVEDVARGSKTASVVNPKHPLILTFNNYCDSLQKLSHIRVASEDVLTHLEELSTFIKYALRTQAEQAKEAASGKVVGPAVQAIAKNVRKAGGFVKDTAEEAGEALTAGLGGGRGARLAGGAVKYSPHIALGVGAGLGAEELHERYKYSPGPVAGAARSVGNRILAAVYPTSEAGQMRRYQLQSGGQ
jgi:hypothetical protein